jgi:hypothetical protein
MVHGKIEEVAGTVHWLDVVQAIGLWWKHSPFESRLKGIDGYDRQV